MHHSLHGLLIIAALGGLPAHHMASGRCGGGGRGEPERSNVLLRSKGHRSLGNKATLRRHLSSHARLGFDSPCGLGPMHLPRFSGPQLSCL